MTTSRTMRVRVRLFGRYRELGAGPAIELEVPADATVRDLVTELHRRDLGPLPARPVVAVDHRPAADDVRLEPGAEIALIPPVAGG